MPPTAAAAAAEEPPAGGVVDGDLKKIVAECYAAFAMSSNGRGIPDVRDGFKPVHRRILYGMSQVAATSHVKSARIVGDVLGKYHPHGVSSVYDAMSRMAQAWQNHVPLVDGQGNFGAIDGSSPAAMRYTLARLSPAAKWLVMDGIEHGAVPMVPNYDVTEEEPMLMPSKLPMLLLNGVPSGSIGVGWASVVPPHNAAELARACLMVVRNMAAGHQSTVASLMALMPGPDFPTGGITGGVREIAEAYETGQGSIRIRSVAEVDEARNRIVFTAIPYGETTAGILADVAEAALGRKDPKTKQRAEPTVPEVRDVVDETAMPKGSGRVRVRIVVFVKQGENPHVVLEKLYKHTKLQTSMSVNMNALDRQGQPQMYGVIAAIEEWAVFRSGTVVRAASGRLEEARSREHVLEGLLIALGKIDEVVKLVRASSDDAATTLGLRKLLGVTTKQAEAIASMQLRRLNGLRSDEIHSERRELGGRIEGLLALITDPAVQVEAICAELEEAIRRFPEPRRTQIQHIGEQADARLFVAPEDGLVSITGRGYLRKQAAAEFRAQHRGGVGKKGARVKADDVLRSVISCHSHDAVFAFVDSGRVTKMDAHEIPAGEAGRHAANLGIGEGEFVVSALAAPWPLDETGEVVLAIDTGDVKRVPLPALVSRMTKTLNLYKGEGQVVGATLLPGGAGEIFIASSAGLGTRFLPADIRLSQRDSGGVRGIDLPADARLVSLGRIDDESEQLIMCVASDGYGKRVATDQFPLQNRGGRGRILMKLHEGAELIAAMILREDDTVLVATRKGMTARFRASEIRELGRAAMGSRVMSVAEGDSVVAAAVLPPGDEED